MSCVSNVVCEKFCVVVRESSFGGDGLVCECVVMIPDAGCRGVESALNMA
jgi:hypothetical protein